MSDQILSEFLAETEDLLEVLFGDLQALRVRRAEGRARRELVGRIFRHVHTVKGSSATVELNSMTRIAHEFESLLDGVRLGRVGLEDPVLDALDDAAAALSQSLERAARGETEAQDQALVERLRSLAKTDAGERRSPAVRRALAALPEEIARSLNEHEAHRLQESIEEGARAYVVTVHFELATFDERFRNLSDALAEDGEIISTLPGLEGASPDQISFRIVYAAEASREELASRVGAFGQLMLTELVTPRADEGGVAPEEGAAAEAEAGPLRPAAPFSSRVRIELGELDEVIAAAHEARARTTAVLGVANQQGMARPELTEGLMDVRGRLAELEERLIGLRMVPVAQMLERAARAGRIAARLTGKQIDFEVRGGDVRLDKSLADAMADPLLHILRNAVDHGVETPAERRAAGKNERAVVRLEAAAEGSRVVLKVADDGRGLDPLRVTRAAAERGIIETGTVLTKEQAMRLIFRPGFSTAGSVSSVSGRGVGLDVVERAVELAGGELRVASEEAAGMTFVVSLPTTLALTPALVVTSAGQSYCVDERHISETGFATTGDVSRNGGGEWLHWRGAMLPLLRARQLLAQPPSPPEANGQSLAVIIVRAGGVDAAGEVSHAALAVDAFGERTEALVRGLGRYAARWRGISGATELPDGTVALVLDLPRLMAVGS